METTKIQIDERNQLYKLTFKLAIFTILYNLLEGIISTYLGYDDESLALFGFGVDSFIEAISGLGIAHMVIRIKQQPNSNRDEFEKTALKITGLSFYLLAIGLIVTGIYNILTNHKPTATFWGILISMVSILIMWALIIVKTKTGKKLESDAILADAECTKVCIYMSIVLLISSGIYEFFNISYVDSIGTLGIAYFALKEGKECFEKASSNKHCSCENK